jgi:hypothetical protein
MNYFFCPRKETYWNWWFMVLCVFLVFCCCWIHIYVLLFVIRLAWLTRFLFLYLIIDTPTHKKKKEHRRKIMFNYNIHCSGVIRDFRSNNVLDVLTIWLLMEVLDMMFIFVYFAVIKMGTNGNAIFLINMWLIAFVPAEKNASGRRNI